MKGRAFFGASKLMLPGAVIGATFHPGFSEDLSHWRLAIDEDGNLFQDIKVWRWTKESGIIQEERQEQVQIGVEVVLELLLKAEQLGFHSYQHSYNSNVDDLPSYLISVRFGDADTTVNAHGAGWLVREGNVDMKGFAELWNQIHQYAPFPEKL
jgi:hypothetical protein